MGIEKALPVAQIDTLYHLDFRMDNLKGYLEDMAQTINLQSATINQLQAEIKTKISSSKVEKCFKTIAESIVIQEVDLEKRAGALINRPKPEKTGDGIQDSTNMVCNKMEYVNHSTAIIYKDCKMWEERLDLMKRDLNMKVTKEVVKHKVTKAKNLLLNEIESVKKKSELLVGEANRKMLTEVGNLEIEVKENEKKTLWKINDCQSLLQQRIGQEYVDNSIKALEEKLIREINITNEDSFKNVYMKIEENSEKNRQLDQYQQEKQKLMKSFIKELESDLKKQFCTNEQYENNRIILHEKISDLYSKAQAIDKKGSAIEIENKLNKIIAQLQAQILALQREDINLKNMAQELDQKIELMGPSEAKLEKDKKEQEKLEFHKVCEIDGQVKRQQVDLDKLQQSLMEQNEVRLFFQLLSQIILAKDFLRKFQMLEHKVLGQFAGVRKGEAKMPLSREEANQMIERNRISGEERTKIIRSDMDEVKLKWQQVLEMDKFTKKKLKELSEGKSKAEMLKMIESKADKDELVNLIKNIQFDTVQLRDQIEILKKDNENLIQMKDLNKQGGGEEEESISVLANRSQTQFHKCGSCGNKQKHIINRHKQCLQPGELRGSDGKIYRGDINLTQRVNSYDQQEVFSYPQSQSQALASNQQDHILLSQKNPIFLNREKTQNFLINQKYDDQKCVHKSGRIHTPY